jgi:hypothetical protein
MSLKLITDNKNDFTRIIEYLLKQRISFSSKKYVENKSAVEVISENVDEIINLRLYFCDSPNIEFIKYFYIYFTFRINDQREDNNI